jgi:hypothetical protein
MVLNSGVDRGGIFEKVGIYYPAVHIACAGEELVDIYAAHCRAEKTYRGKNAESPTYPFGNFQCLQSGIGRDFAKGAFERVGGRDDVVFEPGFAEFGFEQFLDEHKLRGGFGGLA